MIKISEGTRSFFCKQSYTILTTIDSNGHPHNSCKGIVHIDEEGKVYLMDLYNGETKKNLISNNKVSITAVDEHKFIGFTIKGTGRPLGDNDISEDIIKKWEEKLLKRHSNRLVKNLHGEKGHPRHPEALLPKPEYLIVVEVEKIIDLTPHHINK